MRPTQSRNSLELLRRYEQFFSEYYILSAVFSHVQSENDTPQREAIVLHPGSSNLYVGFASDSAPQSIPHLIAYRQLVSHDQSDKSRDEGTGSHDRPRNDEESLVLEYKTEITVSYHLQFFVIICIHLT